jgi:NAD(P)-dependent dehydrogenase (short-subunit alcohol dehydrogenase family)
MKKLENKIVFITGGLSGIGMACAFTAIKEGANAGITKDSDLQKYIIGLYPMKRLGKPEEVASGFIFLASDDSSFLTGTALEIECGFLA